MGLSCYICKSSDKFAHHNTLATTNRAFFMSLRHNLFLTFFKCQLLRIKTLAKVMSSITESWKENNTVIILPDLFAVCIRKPIMNGFPHLRAVGVLPLDANSIFSWKATSIPKPRDPEVQQQHSKIELGWYLSRVWWIAVGGVQKIVEQWASVWKWAAGSSTRKRTLFSSTPAKKNFH